MADNVFGSTDTLFGGLESALKVYYTDQQVRSQCYEEHPFFGMVSKKEDVKGLVWPIPLVVSPETGAAHDFGIAQASANSFTPDQFMVQMANDYVTATLPTKAMLASAGDAGAWLDLSKAKIDYGIHAGTRRLSLGLFRNATGIVAQISTITAGVATLVDRGSVVAFEKGQRYFVTATSTPTSTSDLLGAVEGTDVGYVRAVDRNAGTVSFSKTRTGSVESIGNSGTVWAANHYLVPCGDIGAGWVGLDSLFPAGTPGALYGVTRTADRQRYAGSIYDGTTLSESVQETLIQLGLRVCETGIGSPSHIFMPYTSFGSLLKDVGSKVVNIKEPAVNGKGEKMSISYSGIELYLPSGRVAIIPDRDCLPRTAFMLDMSRMKLGSYGPAIRVLSPDGLKWLRQASSDGAEVRIGGFCNLTTDSPGAHGRATLMF